MPDFTEKRFLSTYNAVVDNHNRSISTTRTAFEEMLRARITKYSELASRNIDELIVEYMSNPDFFNIAISSYIHSSYLVGQQQEMLSQEDFSTKYNALKSSFKNFKIVSYSDTFTSFTWTLACVMEYTDPTTNTYFTYDFGQFTIYLTINFNDLAYVVKASPCGNNTAAKSNSSVYHPHIGTNSKVCIGSYSDYIKGDLSKKAVLDIIYNISAVLQEYNPQSLYNGIDISSWIGSRCSLCLGFIPEKEKVVKCAKTMCEMHEACATKFENKYYNPVYIKDCTRCGKSSPAWVVKKGEIICGDCECQQS